MTACVRVGVAGGTGVLVRRDESLLFVSDRSVSPLVDRFLAAHRSDPIDLASSPETVGSSTFVHVDWSSGSGAIRVITSSDIEVSRDVEPAETTVGPDSSIRIEQWAPHGPGEIVLGVGGPCGPDTDLRDGVVPAGGFEFAVSFPRTTLTGAGAPATEDWMEESLQLDRPTTARPPTTPEQPTEATSIEHPLDRDVSDGSPGSITVELPDGTRHPIDGTLVIGRRPDADAAGVPGAGTVELEAPANVSRTHVMLSTDGTALLATDCGTSGGTALIRRGGVDPIRLEPWSPSRLCVGDRLYLGGTATRLTIHESPEEQTR